MIHKTANIYQFSAGGRSSISSRRMETRPVAQLRVPSAPQVAIGDGWYHDAAIQDAQRPGKQH